MIRFFAGHRTAANLVLLGIVALGLQAIPQIKRETFPDIAPDEVQIRVMYPAATAEDVEDAVCSRLEDALEAVERLDEIRCEARENVGIAVAKMEEGADIDRFTDDVKTEVEAIDSFPDLVERPIVSQLGRRDFVAAVAVTGPMDAVALRSYAEALKDRMRQLGEVSEVTIRGFATRQVRISLDEGALRRHGLTVAEVADLVERQNVGRPAGLLETDGRDLTVRFFDERRTAPGLRDLVVMEGEAGGVVRLGDIAIIDERFENDWDAVSFDGARAALLEVTKTKSQDALDVMAALQRFLDAERGRAPPGVSLTVTADMASIVEDRLDTLTGNGIQGLVLVFLILWLFFSFRYAFWVAAGLPVAFLGTLFGMELIGYSIDMITMVGLLIAIGLMMDDAIVIAENVAAHRARGKPPFHAAVDGVREVAGGVVSSFLTTVCIFGTLAFMEGRMGQVLRVMPVVLILTLTFSLIEAFLILPNHLAHAVAHTVRERRWWLRRRFEAGFERLREEWVGGLVDRAVRWRWATVGVLGAVVVASLALPLSGALKFRAFPKLEGDVVEARILLPQGTPFARTQQVVDRVSQGIRTVQEDLRSRQPDGADLVRHVSVAFGQNRDAFEEGPHVATVTVDLLSAEVRDARIDDILDRWRAATGALPDVVFIKYTEREMGPAGRDIDIRLRGDDLAALDAAGNDLVAWLSRYRGAHDVADDLRPGKPELRVTLREGATALGFTAESIAAQLRAALQGVTVDEFERGGQTVEIDVRLAERDRDDLGDLDDFFVSPTGGGIAVPLSAVATVTEGRGWARIHRVDGRRTVSVQGLVSAQGNAAEIIADTRARFLPELLARYPGVTVSLEGQAKETAKTGSSVRSNLLLGLVGVYLLLALQFRSYLEPVTVILAIPLALIGAIWGHYLLGMDLSMPSVVGLASLTGVVVNDSILLVLFIKMRLRAGESVEVAAPQAARQRFRAIILTSATTVGGLVPLLAETSLQAQVLQPLAVSLAFGLSSATLLGLFLVPCLYAILEDLGLTEPQEDEDHDAYGEETAPAPSE